jgi:formylglycine-generating enzyme required for sulfatase activity
MKHLLFLIIAMALFQVGLHAQPSMDKAFLKKVNLIPTKTPSVFMFKYEVSNLGYREMMAFAKQKDTALYRFLLPDTSVWLTPLGSQEAFFEYYFRHPAYSVYPVVGVSYEQATAYCQLLTEFFNSQVLPENKWLKKVNFRLPTEKEWEEAARGSVQKGVYPWSHDGIRDPKKHTSMANILYNPSRFTNSAGYLNDGLDFLAIPESFPPNSIGLYHMAGNAAEMVAEKSISKGGCWRFGALNARIDSTLTYSQPESWLGFRYVMEVEEFRNEADNNNSKTLDVKTIEKLLVYMNDTTKHYMNREDQPCVRYSVFGSGRAVFQCKPFYISSVETSNELYGLFLADMAKRNGKNSSTYAPKDSLWSTVTPLKIYQHYSQQDRFNTYPVVNISKASAEAFCAWLTEKYNADPKRKFKKVAFSLPTEEEWVLAANKAYGKSKNQIELMAISPPDGTSFTFNYCPYDERYSTRLISMNGWESTGYIFPENDSTQTLGLDGYLYTAPINAFSSKNSELCNMLGNVAEMVNNQVFTKGGSWASMEENLQLASGECANGPSPTIGFRFVMHVHNRDGHLR